MTTTYQYVSLIRATMDNPEWGDDEGDRCMIAGKVDEVYTPQVPTDREHRAVVGRRYEREAMAKLPRWMTADDAFSWVESERPESFEVYFAEVDDE